jgi:hypothetical protein
LHDLGKEAGQVIAGQGSGAEKQDGGDMYYSVMGLS